MIGPWGLLPSDPVQRVLLLPGRPWSMARTREPAAQVCAVRLQPSPCEGRCLPCPSVPLCEAGRLLPHGVLVRAPVALRRRGGAASGTRHGTCGSPRCGPVALTRCGSSDGLGWEKSGRSLQGKPKSRAESPAPKSLVARSLGTDGRQSVGPRRPLSLPPEERRG